MNTPASDDRANVLIIADSHTNADLYYATRFLVGDPVVYLEIEGRKILLVSDLEYGRAKREARVDDVVSTAPFEEELRRRGEAPRPTAILDLFLRSSGVRRFSVPATFPLGHAERLSDLGYELAVRDDPFFPERAVKTPEEIDAIHASQRAAEECMRFLVDTIRRSEIRGDTLYAGGEPLTADRLRREAHKLLLDLDCHAENTIIAGGDQGCDPHERGSGPLPAHRTIVIDIFPRSSVTRYWGDITRTVVRGDPGPEVRKLYEDVLAAQEAALSRLRDGADPAEVHAAVVRTFEERGRFTGEQNGRKVGFMHSTGHGVGLDIHEPPKIGRLSGTLKAGQCVTIEPGLYYPGLGAVRIEDLVCVTEDGYRNLTSFPKEFELG